MFSIERALAWFLELEPGTKYGYLEALEIFKLIEDDSDWNDSDEEGESNSGKEHSEEVDETPVRI